MSNEYEPVKDYARMEQTIYERHDEENLLFLCAVTAQLISAFVFAT